MAATLKVGLTGGIGSGKSTVARLLCQFGCALIDADAISKASTEPGGSAIETIEKVFGPDVITKQGCLDRAKMRDLVFGDAHIRLQLESIIHPLVQLEISRQSAAAEAAGYSCTILDIPLLVESKDWRGVVDQILVVDCMEQTQISRVTARDGLTLQTIEKIISTQAPRELRVRAADIIIFNDGITLQLLASEVHQIAVQIRL